MRKTENHRQGFSLAELIMAIALLAVFGVLVARMFFLADQIAQRTENLDRAVVLAGDLAETWQSQQPGYLSTGQVDLSLLIEQASDQQVMTIPIGADFKPCEQTAAVHEATLTMHATGMDGLWQLDIVIGPKGPSETGPIYRLETSRYIQETEVDQS